MISYEEYKKGFKTSYPPSSKCYMCGNSNAVYEGGDSRFYYPACEKCFGIPYFYEKLKNKRKETDEIVKRTRIHKFDNEVYKYEY